MDTIQLEDRVTAEVFTITVPFLLNVSVNCFLVRGDDGYLLIDSGRVGKRADIEQAIRDAGCRPGELRLIILTLTHGDFDHSGNAAYLREQFGSRVAMHQADAGMVERGDMFWNRSPPNRILKFIMDSFYSLHEADRFTPDLLLADGEQLSEHGPGCQVLHIPGHSSGSIGVLTTAGDLFCGDLLANVKKPAVWSIIDDQGAAQASVAKLARHPITTVYPGHGEPFPMEKFLAEKR